MNNDLILGRISPEEAGISSAAVLKCLKKLDATPNEIHGFVAARHGRIFAESYLAPYAGDLPHTCHSLGKSYTCTGALIAMTEGLLKPDDLLIDLFQEEFDRYDITPCENMKKLSLRHVMSMTCGMKNMPAMEDFWIENFLSAPVEAEPGTEFMYNSAGSCMLGAAVEKAVGRPLRDYMQEKLFDKIGINEKNLIWQKFSNGCSAEPGISATTDANLRLGLFYLAKGALNGETVVDPALIQEAMQLQVRCPDGRGYGWQLWTCRAPGRVRFDGGQGQYCIIDPALDMAVSIHEGGMHPRGVEEVLSIIEDMMDEAREALPDNPEAERAMRAYLDNRAVAAAPAVALPAGAKALEGVYAVTEGTFVPWIEVAPMGEDFYHMFYDPAVNRFVNTFSLQFTEEELILGLNRGGEIRASLRGEWTRRDTTTPLPGMTAYAATARFDGDDPVIELRWLNGWCCPVIRFHRCGKAEVEISVEKSMRHEGVPPMVWRAKARRSW